MGGSKEKSHLEIVLDANRLVLKGTGVNVEPVRLAGNLVLHLSEDTSIRELTLQFRGKSKVSLPVTESLVGTTNNVQQVVCNHDWSFLEGDGRHAKTIKAGRHVFPFHYDLTGSLPSTVFSNAFGGGSISYKLRAVAVRPGLMSNLTQVVPVTIMRTLTSEALEYQQSLEIENTWPEKLMYAIMLPHKAWAGGDTLSAILKFSPLAKGVAVDNIVTTLCETTKVSTRTGLQEDTRVLVTARHEIVNGRAVNVRNRPQQSELSSSLDQDNQDIVTCVHLPVPRSTLYIPTTPFSPASDPSGPSTPLQADAGFPDLASPVRWTIFIRNLDGHVSELRCSLPVTIIDSHFLEEARAYSSLSRSLLFEASGLANELALPGGSRLSSDSDGDGDRDLPSYRAHVRDRVPDILAPWSNDTSPASRDFGLHSRSASGSGLQPHMSPVSQPQSGYGTPSRTSSYVGLDGLTMSQLPQAPAGSSSTPLDWVNSELVRLNIDRRGRGDVRSRGSSRASSARGSRVNSRAPSPERRLPHEPTPSNSVHFAPTSTTIHEGHSHDRNHHSHSHSSHSRGFSNFLRATIKPFTSLTGQAHPSATASPIISRPPSRGHNHGDALDGAPHRTDSSASMSAHHHLTSPSTPSSLSISGSDSHYQPTSEIRMISQHTINDVPDYSTASRAFIGGVPPLSSLRDLPSYEEAQRRPITSPLSARGGHGVGVDDNGSSESSSASGSDDGHASAIQRSPLRSFIV